MKTALVVAVLVLGMMFGVLMTVPRAAAAASVTIDPPRFDGFYYIPGEQMQFTIEILAADPRDYDVQVVFDDGATRQSWSDIGGQEQFDDVNIPTPQTSLVLNFDLPANIPDGDWYWVEVHDTNWFENGEVGTNWDAARFFIRTWELDLEMDRPRYLPGDTVKVIWSVNLIRDGSLAPQGWGQLFLWDWPTNNPLISPNPYQFTASTGDFSFTLLGTIPTSRWIQAYAYFNNTQTAADRISYSSAFAPIDGLRMMVSVPAAQYEPAGIVTVDVSAKITDFAPVAADPGASDVEVDISVTDQSTGQVVAAYGVQNLLTDTHGNLKHVFQLDANIVDGTSFLVRADGVANNAVTNFGTDTFVVSSNAGMTLVLTFDKAQYLSGDRVTMTAQVGGSTGPFTYVYEARDGSAFGSLLDRTTSTMNTYQYTIPATFDGPITFIATADDGQGNRVASNRQFTVALGILTVSLDRAEYNPGERVTASFTLTTAVMTSPTFYYEVFDTSVFPSVLVASGVVAGATATSGSVGYTTPAVPADSYSFRITATENGRGITGSADADLVSGVLLSIGLDKTTYAPGETMRITYQLVPRGRTALPRSFTFLVALSGGTSIAVQSTSPSGVLSYTVPGGMNEGETALQVFEFSTGAFAIEIVRIGAGTLWTATIGDMPAIVAVIGLLLAFAFILLFLMWRRMMPGMAPRAPAERPSHAPPPPASASPGAAPMTVACRACGASIEITTSKRPIEVMCPSCGETQMVQ